MTTHRWAVVVAAAGSIAAALPTASAVADHTDPPAAVTVAGSFQSELGCPGDWQPECPTTALTEEDGVWQGGHTLPAGDWAYKAALDLTWDESYGGPGGADIPLSLAADTAVRFYYSHDTHWVADSVTERIATAAGDFQSELGCAGDWLPDCLRSWLQDADDDGIYELRTTAIPAGAYEWKVAIAEGWDESYGGPGGANLTFTVTADDQPVTFRFDGATNTPSVEVGDGSGLEPGDAELVTPPVRTPAADEVVYFVMTDRFADGAPGNNRGGSPSDDRLVTGLRPDRQGVVPRRRPRRPARPPRLPRGPRRDRAVDHAAVQEPLGPGGLRRLPRLLAGRLHPDRPAPRHQRRDDRPRRRRPRPRDEGLLRHRPQPHR